ncbi:maleylpyruvate isomerase N-terminal domain-containing protein, partial [Streptomyces sp. NPDC059425]|uniref:maleylpyruvate isomerase N-terminal domain-containing protein n=1 Tax=Streptomyces sp. NPDC059425 TaxID=3346826 RepID=UPI00367964BF
AWSTPTPAPGWTVTDQIAHLTFVFNLARTAAGGGGGVERPPPPPRPMATHVTESRTSCTASAPCSPGQAAGFAMVAFQRSRSPSATRWAWNSASWGSSPRSRPSWLTVRASSFRASSPGSS